MKTINNTHHFKDENATHGIDTTVNNQLNNQVNNQLNNQVNNQVNNINKVINNTVDTKDILKVDDNLVQNNSDKIIKKEDNYP